MSVDVIIPAAGRGLRLGKPYNKVLMHLQGLSVIESTVDAFYHIKEISYIYVACAKVELNIMKELLSSYDRVKCVLGGTTRGESVYNALQLVKADYVLVHDAARPFVSSDVINRVIETTESYGAAIPTMALTDTIKEIKEQTVLSTPNRENFVNVQTPQGFLTRNLLEAYNLEGSLNLTDDSAVYEKLYPVKIVDGSRENIKLTYIEDFEMHQSSNVKECVGTNLRVGLGIDAHRLVENRKLILGGVTIPYEKGLLGHSDADVLLHAICDSLLSAINKRDIGVHFPDTDLSYEGISSTVLLEKVNIMLNVAGYKIENISAVIIAEKPKLAPFIDEMVKNIASILGILTSQISIAATTTEKLGFCGRGEGIASEVYSLVSKGT